MIAGYRDSDITIDLTFNSYELEDLLSYFENIFFYYVSFLVGFLFIKAIYLSK